MEALKTYMAERKLSVLRLARTMEVSPQTVYSWLGGRISGESARKLHERTGIPLYRIRPDLWPRGNGEQQQPAA